jgi:hypothetical protein
LGERKNEQRTTDKRLLRHLCKATIKRPAENFFIQAVRQIFEIHQIDGVRDDIARVAAAEFMAALTVVAFNKPVQDRAMSSRTPSI